MSCRAMGMGGELIVGGIVVVTILYGCGPNIIVGAVGTTVTGMQAINDKIKKVFAESEFAKSDNVFEREKLTAKVKVIDESLQKHLKNCSLWALSMIPIVGPIIVMIKTP